LLQEFIAGRAEKKGGWSAFNFNIINKEFAGASKRIGAIFSQNYIAHSEQIGKLEVYLNEQLH